MAVKKLQSKKIWIDATGILRWGPQPATGFQRVELGLCEYALDNPDSVGICALDTVTLRYVRADAVMLDYIRLILRLSESSAGTVSRAERFAHLGLQLRFADNETARMLACIVLNTERRRGAGYVITKTAVRLVLWCYALLRFAASLPSVVRDHGFRRGSGLSDESPFIIVSHEVNRHRGIERALSWVGAREANIIYDLIPVLMPKFTSTRYSRKMGELFVRILNKENEVFAISQVTANDIRSWDHDVVKSAGKYRIHICPLNSSVRSDPTKDVPIPELVGKPFALFCSTIDIRKGQWLLVAVWNRLSKMLLPEALPDLVLIGRKGTGFADLERELAAAQPVADKIHVLHGIKDSSLNWAYRNALLTMYPSRAEGWGLGVSESLAHGVPVIHFDIPILHEAAHNLMPSAAVDDVDAWTSVLHDHLAHPQKIDALAVRIRKEYKPGEPGDFARCVVSRLHEVLAGRFDQTKPAID